MNKSPVKKSNPQWLKELQSYANKCTFWIFSCHYPWNHPAVPKNMSNNLTLMADGFPTIRFKVLKGRQSYSLLQSSFTIAPYAMKNGKPHPSIGKKKISDAGILFKFFQKFIWKQDWNKPITEKQLREFMKWYGLISCGQVSQFCKIWQKTKMVCLGNINSAALKQQMIHGLRPHDEFLYQATLNSRYTKSSNLYIPMV